MPDVAALIPAIRRRHDMIRAAVVEGCERASMDGLSLIAEDAAESHTKQYEEHYS